jgi:predicted dinucleotide-binding enzyme
MTCRMVGRGLLGETLDDWAKLVKVLGQLPMRALIAPVPEFTGIREVVVASDHEDASTEFSRQTERLEVAPIEAGPIVEGGRLIPARAASALQDFIHCPA